MRIYVRIFGRTVLIGIAHVMQDSGNSIQLITDNAFLVSSREVSKSWNYSISSKYRLVEVQSVTLKLALVFHFR
ncbi:MAG: hypothetical protein JRN52_15455 [Nitrososphaerota archaeon]|nr:hypothetical protein [Nitrososphaerota archaeon]